MSIQDKLYEILDNRYERLWLAHRRVKTGKVPKVDWDGLTAHWYELLRSHGIMASTAGEDRSGWIFIKDPSTMADKAWISIPEEMAMKIMVLGTLP